VYDKYSYAHRYSDYEHRQDKTEDKSAGIAALAALFAAVMLVRRKLSIMALIFLCAALGVAAVPFS
jgi:mannose/fructose/N-acetylgalactosamine-specific phosphotransferase system component IID